MLGPSGSGKTTCLRLIAGFESPDTRQRAARRRDVTDDPPFARDVNTVFQDYALFPHMSVLENVAYGPARARRRQGRASGGVRARCSSSCNSASSAIAGRRSSPAVSASASRWRARSDQSAAACCCSMSRSARST